MKKAIVYFLSFCTMFVLFSFTVMQQQKPFKRWDVPSEYEVMKNPLKRTDKVIALGKSTYNMNCAGCHGKSGKGDGEKIKNLVNITPANLTLEAVTHESDGNHFYKIKFGRDNLHSFRGKLDDETIWSTVYYTRTFSGK